jgi:hypothetical protein
MLCTYTFDSRVVGSTNGTVDRIRACNLGAYRIATAVRHKKSQKLEVITWDVAPTAAKLRLADAFSDYEVGAIAIAAIPGGSVDQAYVVTAAQHAGGKGLHVTLWWIQPDSVTRVDDVRSDPVIHIENVAIASIDRDRFVTAAIGTDGRLHLHGWRLAGKPGSFGPQSIEQFAHHEGHAATQPAVTVVGGRPVVAKRNAAGKCELVTFDISGADFAVRDTDRTSGKCSDVAITQTSDGVAIAIVDEDGKVNAHAWRIDPDGTLEWIGHRQGSKGKRVSILALGPDGCGDHEVAAEHVVAVSVGEQGWVHLLAVDTDENPLPLMIDEPIVTTSSRGASAVLLPGIRRINNFETESRVDEILIPFIDAIDEKMRLLFLSASRTTEIGL